ncbi:alpha-L-rhamnosidase [Paenibacillus sp. BIHB 4019]|uniref:Alpha-L-rhamnosidase n=1 Tax=Paenibacillus sp. BIHB 4019 TaxID=1870819 RepID=A0A1B2DKK3_9BACL|nr:alpha-L-rhamnosidase N-terminal domain-containing protein [Paenibacillus sp. BIHB 4019]ANY68211.1 alpha-L-rhamnosidase [Paenibacillus sp. BIHB 4019]
MKLKQDWQAKWIWSNTPVNTPNVYTEARTLFLVDSDLQEAVLHISANQEYKLFVNGAWVGNGPSPSDNAWQYYDSYEVANLLHSGANSIAIVAYNFSDTHIYNSQKQGPGGIVAQLDMLTDEGDVAVYTDERWKCRRSSRWVHKVSRMHAWNGFKEIYLAEQEDGWEQTEYDDSNWAKARIVSEVDVQDTPWLHLIPREIPFLAREDVKPEFIIRVEENYGAVHGFMQLLKGASGNMEVDASVAGSMPAVVFDFAAEKVGYPIMDIAAPEGGVVQLYYGESLELVLVDTFVLKKGFNRLSPFGRRAFRYVKLAVQAAAAPLLISNFRVQFVSYPFTQEGSFCCNDALLNQIWDIGRYTTRVNSQDHLEDCPYREQALWVVDAVVMGKVIYQTFGDTALLRKCLLQLARIQNEDGSIPGTGPERNSQLLPDFNAYWLLGVYDYWIYSGDKGFILELETTIRKLLAWFGKQEDDDGLFARADRSGWWCFVDWADYMDKRDRVTAISCLYYKVLRSTEELAAVFEDEGFSRECAELAERLNRTVRLLLRIPDSGLYADCLTDDGLSSSVTYQTNFIALWSGLMTDEEADDFIQNVFAAGQCPELKGAFFYHIVLEALFTRGYVNMALNIMRDYWGGMVARGATTWWETFDPSSSPCTIPSPYQGNTPSYLSDDTPVSLCHGWGAAPTYLLTRQVLGIDVSNLSSGEFVFHPKLGDLTWAKGTVPTSFGYISVELVRESDGSLMIDLEYPECLSARFMVYMEQFENRRNGRVFVARGKIPNVSCSSV